MDKNIVFVWVKINDLTEPENIIYKKEPWITKNNKIYFRPHFLYTAIFS